MTKADAVAYWGNQSRLADALDLSPSSVCEWGTYPPYGVQCEIELLSKGKLKREPKVLTKRVNRLARPTNRAAV